MSINKKPPPPVDVINEDSGPPLTDIETLTPIDLLHVESQALVKEPKKKLVGKDNRLKQREKLNEVPTKKSSRSH